MKRGSTADVSTLKLPTGTTFGGLVDQPDADRVRADHPGVDRVLSPGARQRVESGNDPAGRIAERIDVGRVLDLVQPDDSGLEAGDRGEELVTLTRELRGLVGVVASALEVLVPAAPVVGRGGRIIAVTGRS